MKTIKPYVSLAMFCFLIAGCQMNSAIKGTGSSASTTADFEKTEVIAGGPALADGNTQLLVAVHLKNSDNKPVPDYLPKYKVTGANVLTQDCSTSDANGVSACILKSTAAGKKMFTLTNAKVGLAKEIEFTPRQSIERAAASSGSIMNGTTPDGSAVQVTLGNPIKGVKHETNGGYKVELSVQGAQ